MAKFPVKHIAGSEQLIDCLVPVAIDFAAATFASKICKTHSTDGYFYYETFDTTPVNGKTYYIRSGSAEPFSYTEADSNMSTFGSTTYYERLTIDDYVLSSDTSVGTNKTYYTRSGSGTSTSPYVYTEVASPSGNPHSKNYYEFVAVAAVYMELPASGCEGIVGIYYRDGSKYRLKSDCADVLFIPGSYNTSNQTGLIHICAKPFDGRVIYLRRMVNRDVATAAASGISTTSFISNPAITYNS